MMITNLGEVVVEGVWSHCSKDLRVPEACGGWFETFLLGTSKNVFDDVVGYALLTLGLQLGQHLGGEVDG